MRLIYFCHLRCGGVRVDQFLDGRFSKMLYELHADKEFTMVIVNEAIYMAQTHGTFFASTNGYVVVQTKRSQDSQVVLLDFIKNDAFHFLVRHGF